jgi:2-hydroxyglutaryl-CoA dehydratase, D-component
VSQFTREPPDRWWELHRNDCETMLDLKRVEQRLEQIKGLIAHLEAATGRPFSLARFRDIMETLNAHMDAWEEARDLMAAARPTPVSLRDQMAAYQVTWQRGTQTNLDLVRDYLEEVMARVAAGEGAYAEERFRLYLATSGNDPQYHAYLREAHGGVIVSNRYSSIAPMYARTIRNDDPLWALASRHLFLFDKEPLWEIHEARRWGCQGIIGLEPDSDTPSYYREACEAAGFAYLGLPADDDSEATRARIDRFVMEQYGPR